MSQPYWRDAATDEAMQGELLDWLDYYRDQKLLLRFSRDASSS
jgi:hypothetical protein